MKKSCIFIVIFVAIANSLFSAVVITRSETDVVSKEMYHDNRYLELINDRIVSLWDFNKFELTLIDHGLRIYTTIGFENFKKEMERLNRAQIENELRSISDERRVLLANATNNLFRKMKPQFMIADTTRVNGYLAYENHVYNGDVIAQKIWISKTLQERINKEVNPVNIKHVESLFKNNRSKYFEAMGISLDPVSALVESIEEVGYITKRVDFGLRDKSDPEFEKRIESEVENVITNIEEMKVDSRIFSQHQRYRKLEYNAYQIAVIKSME